MLTTNTRKQFKKYYSYFVFTVLISALGLIPILNLYQPAESAPNNSPTDNTITDPPTFQWTHHPVTANNLEEYYSGTLEYGEETFIIGGDTFTTRAYRQAGSEYTIPGPTIFMEPGNKYVLRFKNTLPYSEPSSTMNDFKDPDITNVHTHGLHISPKSPADDVLRMFEGGTGGDYVYDIPDDHMGGTYWYHAHHHGSTFLQVTGGSFGLMIIDDSLDEIPSNVANMVERQLVVGFLDSDAAGTGGDTIMDGTFSPSWTVNGKVEGDLYMPPNTWQHWRILLADAEGKTKTLTIGPDAELALLARDGVWRTKAPKDLTTDDIKLTGASRVDIAVRANSDFSIKISNKKVANVIISGDADTSVHPYAEDGVSMWSAKRPDYLRDLRDITDVNTETISMGARTINGEKFDHDVPGFTFNADETQEWTLKGANMHPFHLHVYHMQMIGDTGEYEDGEYYDTIAANSKIRFDLNAQTSTVYAGPTIMHCHVLDHEDQGAMTWADVTAGLEPPGYPVNGDIGITYSLYYTFGEPDPNSPPVANDDSASTPKDTSVTIDVLDNDVDTDGTLDTTTVTLTSLPGDGQATVNQDGTITYTPYTDFTGTDSFTYTVKDDDGDVSNEATVTVTIQDVQAGLEITDAKYKGKTSTWDIAGTDLTDASITIYIGETLSGEILGTATVDSNGDWRFRERKSASLPDSTNTISVESSTGEYILAYPITIS
jgi:FtsP/CotA-like multicopper oxidase with cupredoxin domain